MAWFRNLAQRPFAVAVFLVGALGAIFGGNLNWAHGLTVGNAVWQTGVAVLVLFNSAGAFIGHLAPTSDVLFAVSWTVHWVFGLCFAAIACIGAVFGAGATWAVTDVAGALHLTPHDAHLTPLSSKDLAGAVILVVVILYGLGQCFLFFKRYPERRAAARDEKAVREERKAARRLGWTWAATVDHLVAMNKYYKQRRWWKSQERLHEANFDLFFDSPSLITPNTAKITNNMKGDLYIGTSSGDYENTYSVSGYLFSRSGEKWDPHEGNIPFLEHPDHSRNYSAANIFWARGLGNVFSAYDFVEHYLTHPDYMQSANFYMDCRVVTREARKLAYQQAQDADDPSPFTAGSKPQPFAPFKN
jgi:hypothetical protein